MLPGRGAGCVRAWYYAPAHQSNLGAFDGTTPAQGCSTVIDDPWIVLGLPRGASFEEVRRAFRRLAWKLHPDRRPGDRAAEERFKDVVEAFAAVTSQAPGRRREPRPASPEDRRRVFDVLADFTMTLGEAVRGGEHSLRLHVRVPCPDCRGVRSRAATCARCRGKGTVALDRRVRLHFPPGLRAGDEIRSTGDGLPFRRGEGRGDLRVRVAVRLPEGLRIDGDDLHLDLPLTVPEAFSGTRVRLPTPQGQVLVTVPSGLAGQEVLRVRGHGLPAGPFSTNPPGDLVLHVLVCPPDRRDAATAASVDALRDGYSADIRSTLARLLD
jgi:DnaJ-class molecular chaperone